MIYIYTKFIWLGSSDSKTLLYCNTFRNILANSCNALVWIVSIFYFYFFSPPLFSLLCHCSDLKKKKKDLFFFLNKTIHFIFNVKKKKKLQYLLIIFSFFSYLFSPGNQSSAKRQCLKNRIKTKQKENDKFYKSSRMQKTSSRNQLIFHFYK